MIPKLSPLRAAAGLALLILALAAPARAAEQVTVTFKTSDPGRGTSGNYNPRNVHVVWVEDANGNFVKTLGRWANSQRSSMKRWWAKSGGTDTDSISGATQSSFPTTAYTATWNMTARGGTTPVPNGSYRIKLELTCNEFGSPSNFVDIPFTKDGVSRTINVGNSGGYLAVTVTYTGPPATLPDINLSPASLAFGQVRTLTTKDLSVNIQNLGAGDLVVSSLGLAGASAAAYQLLSPPALPLTVAPGASRAISVRFTPTAAQTYNGASVSIGSNSPNESVVTLPLTGSGVAPEIALTATSLAFPATAVGASATQAVTVQNSGPVSLNVTGLNIVGLDKGAYSLVSPPALPLTLAPSGGSQALTVRFAPKSHQDYNHAQLAVGSDDPDERVTTVSLTGRGTRAGAALLNDSGTIPGPAGAVVLSGAARAVVGQGAVLALYDVSAPSSPTLLGQTRLGEVIRRLAVSGTTAYAALGQAGVAVIEISGNAPRLLQILDTPGHAYDLALASSALCVADGLGGLRLYSLTSPAAPTYAGVLPTRGPARAVAAAGTTAYVLDEVAGLRTVNVANPASPAALGQYNALEFGTALAVAGTKACACDRLGNFFTLNVSTPASPSLIASRRLGGVGRAVTVAGNRAYVMLGEGGIETIDLGATPPGSLGVGAVDGEAQGAALDGTTAYVAAGSGGLRVLNLSAPATPGELASLPLTSAPTGLATTGDTALIADGPKGLKVVEITSPQSAALRAAVSAVGEARAVALAGPMAYVAAGAEGLKVVDVSNTGAPVVKGSYATAGFANSVAAAGTTVLVADGLKVYRLNVANPAAPALTGSWLSDGYACAVAISGQLAYVANGGGGLRVLSLVNPASLTLAGALALPGVACGVTATGGYAYVACGEAGLQIVNAQNPAAMTLVASFDTPGSATALAHDQGTIYLADGPGGLLTIDVKVPASPLLAGQASRPLHAESLALANGRLIIGDREGGTPVFLIKNEARGWHAYE